MKIKTIKKTLISVALTIAIVLILILSAPGTARAVQVTITGLDTPGSFDINVLIGPNESIPIQNLTLFIEGPTPVTATISPDGSSTSTPAIVTSAYVAPVSYGYGPRYAYGYAYRPSVGYGYYGQWYSPAWGYGYGYGQNDPGTTTLTIRVDLQTVSMSSGNYTAWVSVNTGAGNLQFLSPTYGFQITRAVVTGAATSGGAAAPGAPAAPYAPAVPAAVVGQVDLSAYTTAEGVTTQAVSLTSEDAAVTMDIAEGTTITDAEGNPYTGTITMSQFTATAPAAPAGTNMIVIPYEITSGLVFVPPMTLTLQFDPALIPIDPATGEPVPEENLVIAWYDEVAGLWVELADCVVDTENNTISGPLSHTTLFTILAPVPVPAAFELSDLTITAAPIYPGQSVEISASVANTGTVEGTTTVTLTIDEVVEETQDVTVAGGTTELATFTVTRDVIGTYAVEIDGLTGSFAVVEEPIPAAFTVSNLAITPATVNVGETVTISADIANIGEVEGATTATLTINDVVEQTQDVTLAGGATTAVSFNVTKDVAGTYNVEINGQTGSFTVTAPPSLWWIWIIIAVVVAIGVIVWLVVRRRGAAPA